MADFILAGFHKLFSFYCRMLKNMLYKKKVRCCNSQMGRGPKSKNKETEALSSLCLYVYSSMFFERAFYGWHQSNKNFKEKYTFSLCTDV
jgi:hypothetical protein